MGDEQLVEHPSAVKMLSDPGSRRFIEPFMGGRLETAEAARLLGVTTEVMAYRVNRMHELGLLHAVAERLHAGRAVVTWTAPTAYRCALSALPEADISSAFAVVDAPGRDAFHAGLARAATRNGQLSWDLRVERGENGVQVSMSPSRTSWLPGDTGPAPAVVLSWIPLSLTAAQAVALQERLLAAVQDLDVELSGPSHLCGVFLTPLAPPG